MYSLLLAIIYLAFISLGLPDSLLGAGWPAMQADMGVPLSWAGAVAMIIAAGTIASSLASDRLTRRFGAGPVTAVPHPFSQMGSSKNFPYRRQI